MEEGDQHVVCGLTRAGIIPIRLDIFHVDLPTGFAIIRGEAL
jgi:hypothetical protein